MRYRCDNVTSKLPHNFSIPQPLKELCYWLQHPVMQKMVRDAAKHNIIQSILQKKMQKT